ncbi:MAG: YraN family protein [bacterium]|nr:YraN family protein [bacterium]
MNSTSAGSAAEQAVAEYLQSQGYKIIEMNWKTSFAEIDIVTEKCGILYFVEVKYRHSNIAGDGFDYITSKKLHHMKRAAEAWVLAHKWANSYELMAAAVTKNDQSFEIELRDII